MPPYHAYLTINFTMVQYTATQTKTAPPENIQPPIPSSVVTEYGMYNCRWIYNIQWIIIFFTCNQNVQWVDEAELLKQLFSPALLCLWRSGADVHFSNAPENDGSYEVSVQHMSMQFQLSVMVILLHKSTV